MADAIAISRSRGAAPEAVCERPRLAAQRAISAVPVVCLTRKLFVAGPVVDERRRDAGRVAALDLTSSAARAITTIEASRLAIEGDITIPVTVSRRADAPAHTGLHLEGLAAQLTLPLLGARGPNPTDSATPAATVITADLPLAARCAARGRDAEPLIRADEPDATYATAHATPIVSAL